MSQTFCKFYFISASQILLDRVVLEVRAETFMSEGDSRIGQSIMF